jgi:hypothetical protein
MDLLFVEGCSDLEALKELQRKERHELYSKQSELRNQASKRGGSWKIKKRAVASPIGASRP